MNEIKINDKISYIECSAHPLSADIGIIRNNGITWLFDVGADERLTAELTGSYHIVLSHFHQDHTGNIGRMKCNQLYVSKETYKHTLSGIVVNKEIELGNLHIFPLPSSHAKGCLGLEVDHTYAFVGDALYCKRKDDSYIYNAQLLKDEINVLKKLESPYLLVSHFDGFVRKREDVIAELEAIYQMRVRDDPFIQVK